MIFHHSILQNITAEMFLSHLTPYLVFLTFLPTTCCVEGQNITISTPESFYYFNTSIAGDLVAP